MTCKTVNFNKNPLYPPKHPPEYAHRILCIIDLFRERGMSMSGVEEVRGGYGGLWTSTGVILVLFILLVIISRTFFI